MLDISLSKIKKNYGFKNVLKDLSLDIKTNEKIALIGSNGCGKTTILKIIAGLENIDDGQISIRKNLKIGFLPQNQDYNNEKVKEILYKGLESELKLKEKLNLYEKKLANAKEKELDKIIKTYSKLQEEFINIGGYELESKLNKILDLFKIDKNQLDKSINTLSGGEKTIINLASIVLSDPDLLLLDEPTNYLDIQRIEWLENFLNNYKATLVIVSHDRYFLDKVTTKTILIERENAEIFHGNYSYYLTENENRIMLEFKNYNNQQKQIEAMKNTIKKLREWGKNGDNEKFFKRANSIEKRLEKMEILNKPLQKKEIPIIFDINNRSGKEVLNINNFKFSFKDKEIFNNVKIEIKYHEKICLIGKNGSGKSTLIKEIIKNENPNIKLGSGVSIGYIAQELNFTNENSTVLEEAKKYYHGFEQHLRASLCRFLFYGDNILKKIKNLSGGEKVRLKLFCLMQTNCNFLILDEPTNHIDIDTKEILENALLEFKGTILFISHDRYFINRISDKIYSIENKQIKVYLGNYDYYKEKQ